jgi:ribosomal protein L25 (general stress protein Ctc)
MEEVSHRFHNSASKNQNSATYQNVRYRGKVIQIVFGDRKETNEISKKFKKNYLKKMQFMLRKKKYVGLFQNNASDYNDIGICFIYIYTYMYEYMYMFINAHICMYL